VDKSRSVWLAPSTMCPGVTVHAAAKRPLRFGSGGRTIIIGIAAIGLSIALACAGCSQTMSAYRGTGSLQTSGSDSADLASQTVVFTPCGDEFRADFDRQGQVTAMELVSPSFTTLSIGSECTLDGVGSGNAFVADAGGICTLVFSDGPRSLRVTDVTVRYGSAGRYVDPTYVEVQVGGDDTQDGRHALYRFSGRSVQTTDQTSRCAERRVLHDRHRHADARS
jgi:hypothetical protein